MQASTNEEANITISSEINKLPIFDQSRRLEALSVSKEVTQLLGVLNTTQKHLRSSEQFLRRLTTETAQSKMAKDEFTAGTGDSGQHTSFQEEMVVSFQLEYPPSDASSGSGPSSPHIPKSVTPRGDIRVAIREHFNALLWKDAISRNYRVPWKSLKRNLLRTRRRFVNWPGEIEFRQVLDVQTLKKSQGAELLLEVGIEDWTSEEIRRSRKDNVPLVVSTRGQALVRAGEVYLGMN